MMKTFIYSKFRIIFCLTGIALAAACDGFVDVELPSSQLTGPAVFQDKATANAALVDIYAKMRDNGFLSGNLTGVTLSMGLYADELDYYGPASDTPGYYFQNGLLVTDSNVLQVWNTAYSQIYASNAVLEGLQDSPIAEADSSQFRGEALFIRALLHFYLVNTFGDVPLITTTDYQVNRRAVRTSTAAIYDRLISDLEQAAALTQPAYYTTGRVRPNRAAVNALLAKVYLYNGQWAEASNAASAVLNQSDYSLNVPIAAVFLKESPSTIWQFNAKLEGSNTDFGTTFIFTSGPPPFAALTDDLIGAFEAGDERRAAWAGTVTDGTSTWYYPAKYDQNTATGSSLEFPIIFRVQEQYLIRAEARARQGEVIGAKEDLDAIRSAAGLAPSIAATQQQLIDAILRERRVELFTEYGSRFYDLKRTGMLDAILEAAKPGWNTADALWPLPDTELRANIYLTPQNPGY